MGFRIQESFHVDAPVDAVWRYLIDPRQVVECLPGAELTEAQSDTVYLGKVKVKVGPVTAAYNGKATLLEVDESTHHVRLAAEGRESGGAGSARMTMTSRVSAAATGGCEVQVEAELDVAGKIVQFGRGMIDTVNKQLFSQFTECVRTRLEAPPAAVATGAPDTTAAADQTRVPHRAEPVRVLPLLWHAFVEWLKRLFGGQPSAK